MLTLTINDQKVECPEGSTILAAADAAGIYIPRMCYHADLSTVGDVVWAESVYQGQTKKVGIKTGDKAGDDAHCNLCLVEVAGQAEPVNSCHTVVEDGMVVIAESENVIKLRKMGLSKILADHPHACLTCAQKEGCSRTDCSTNVPVEERCCVLLGHCELEKVSEYIGIPGDTPRFVPSPKEPAPNDLLFQRDYSLCIGCLRCVRICQKLHQLDILGAVWKENRAFVGTLNAGELKEAQCRLCGACIEICPTGALRDKDNVPPVHREAALPCVGNCPAGIDIPNYLRAIAAGQYPQALGIIRKSVPFPGILGYVCFHPCEENCRRGVIDQAVAICDLKRFAADAETDLDSIQIQKKADTGRKIAILGSGPAGLTAAYYLGSQGHQVSIFERDTQPGGMLRYGIPDYRLPQEVLDRELNVLDKLGVDFHLNHQFGGNQPVDELKSMDFEAILVAVGVSASKLLPLENSDLEGVYPALDFLKSAKKNHEPHLNGPAVIVGGGNVAIDAAMTALRLGASPVHLVCLEAGDEMPAHEWEIKQAEEEGIEIHPSWGPNRFLAENGELSGIALKRCTRVFDDQGRFDPQYNDSETKKLPANSIIIAIGQEIEKGLVPSDSANILKVDENFALGSDGVFAAGDVTRGPSSVIDAIADGRNAAEAIDRYLGGNGVIIPTTGFEYPKVDITGDQFLQAGVRGSFADPAKRKSGFGLIQQTLAEPEAKIEAGRCLQCHLRQRITPVVLPPEKWLPLTAEAVKSIPESEGVFQLLNADKKVIRISGTVNGHEGLTECLENPGEAKWFIWQADPMYTKRESELIQQYLQEHGEMPGGGGGDDDLDDLF